MRTLTILASAALAMSAPALAQNAGTDAGATTMQSDRATAMPVEEDHDFPWGLLGLIGLAGLLGRKRDDRHTHATNQRA